MVDIYELLDIPRDADERQIKAAYRKLARECHPDHRPDDPEAAEFFKLVQAAFEILIDPELRAAYDECLSSQEAEEQRKHQAREATSRRRQRSRERRLKWAEVWRKARESGARAARATKQFLARNCLTPQFVFTVASVTTLAFMTSISRWWAEPEVLRPGHVISELGTPPSRAQAFTAPPAPADQPPKPFTLFIPPNVAPHQYLSPGNTAVQHAVSPNNVHMDEAIDLADGTWPGLLRSEKTPLPKLSPTLASGTKMEEEQFGPPKSDAIVDVFDTPADTSTPSERTKYNALLDGPPPPQSPIELPSRPTPTPRLELIQAPTPSVQRAGLDGAHIDQPIDPPDSIKVTAPSLPLAMPMLPQPSRPAESPQPPQPPMTKASAHRYYPPAPVPPPELFAPQTPQSPRPAQPAQSPQSTQPAMPKAGADWLAPPPVPPRELFDPAPAPPPELFESPPQLSGKAARAGNVAGPINERDIASQTRPVIDHEPQPSARLQPSPFDLLTSPGLISRRWYPGPGETATLHAEVPNSTHNSKVAYVTMRIPFGFVDIRRAIELQEELNQSAASDGLNLDDMLLCAFSSTLLFVGVNMMFTINDGLSAPPRQLQNKYPDIARAAYQHDWAAPDGIELLGLVKRGDMDCIGYAILRDTPDEDAFVVVRYHLLHVHQRWIMLRSAAIGPANRRQVIKRTLEDLVESVEVVYRPPGWKPTYAFAGPAFDDR